MSLDVCSVEDFWRHLGVHKTALERRRRRAQASWAKRSLNPKKTLAARRQRKPNDLPLAMPNPKSLNLVRLAMAGYFKVGAA